MNQSDSIIANPQLDEHLIAFISTINNNSDLFHNRNICESFEKQSRSSRSVILNLTITYQQIIMMSSDSQQVKMTPLSQSEPFPQRNSTNFQTKLEKFNNHLNEFVLVDLDNNLIASRGCKFLSKGNWPKLEQLIISNNKIDSCGVRHLVKGNWKTMKLLVINDNLIDEQGVMQLLKCNWKQVELLNLQSNRLKVSGVVNLLRLDMPQMHWLQLRNQMNEQLSSVRFLIVCKYWKLDLRQISL